MFDVDGARHMMKRLASIVLIEEGRVASPVRSYWWPTKVQNTYAWGPLQPQLGIDHRQSRACLIENLILPSPSHQIDIFHVSLLKAGGSHNHDWYCSDAISDVFVMDALLLLQVRIRRWNVIVVRLINSLYYYYKMKKSYLSFSRHLSSLLKLLLHEDLWGLCLCSLFYLFFIYNFT